MTPAAPANWSRRRKTCRSGSIDTSIACANPGCPAWTSHGRLPRLGKPPGAGVFCGGCLHGVCSLPEASDRDVNVAFEFAGQGTKTIDVPLLRDDASSDAIVRVGARQRLASMQVEERQDWAVKYQLMTGETDYLITVERADGEKATDLPELQVQPQMLPAGWGGTSSVVSVQSRGAMSHSSV